MKKRLICIAMISFMLFLTMQPTSLFAETKDPENGTVNDWLKDEKESKKDTEKKTTDNQTNPAEEVPSSSVSIMDFVKMIGALLFVILLIYGLVRFVGKQNRLLKPFRYVENIGGTTVGQNRSVQLIKVGKRVLVVGVADSIQLLKEIDDEQECEAIVKQYEEAMESKTDIPKIVQKFTSQVKKHDKTTTSSFSANLKAQLAELKKTQSEVRKKGPKQDE
ncbi:MULTISPECIES: flagella biosynthesis regulatory protein FliZ [Bacillus]|uniref:Flagella biosynthesis protein FliZ n=1 Tax=Bacillus zhangzhouensis TaxID=1178540 RepID=A0A081LF13_9BACI|nr:MULTISPECIES: flagella biosynthesis regulatory protein FliZ [Bacillus]KEP27839.1 flagella biosynthesis protein FliZ [Bacillus zhangzhouensis]MDR0125863.1 flagella biosynthesis regulatory protein FliZ [Bacillus zhangzhouensis]PRO40660.1 flagella biosynthesis protein FliZ [Bacillus sp. LLTC93]